jgi:hypothetical protein
MQAKPIVPSMPGGLAAGVLRGGESLQRRRPTVRTGHVAAVLLNCSSTRAISACCRPWQLAVRVRQPFSCSPPLVC